MQLCEQYRPTTWKEVVGQDKTIRTIDQLRPRGLAARAYWISGQSGTGKTTIAKLLAGEIANPLAVEEIDASNATPAKLRVIENEMQLYGWGGKGRAYIINEAHGLRKDAIRQLLVLLERIPSHVMLIFTTTNEGEQDLFEDKIDSNPLLSRCCVLALSRRGLAEPFAQRARDIAAAEGLNGKPPAEYLKLMRRCKNNLRTALQTIEAGGMTG